MKISKPEGFPVELETEEIETLAEAAQLIYSMQINLSSNNLTEYVNEENGQYFDNDKNPESNAHSSAPLPKFDRVDLVFRYSRKASQSDGRNQDFYGSVETSVKDLSSAQSKDLHRLFVIDVYSVSLDLDIFKHHSKTYAARFFAVFAVDVESVEVLSGKVCE